MAGTSLPLSFWDERMPPTTFPSGITVLGIDSWIDLLAKVDWKGCCRPEGILVRPIPSSKLIDLGGESE